MFLETLCFACEPRVLLLFAYRSKFTILPSLGQSFYLFIYLFIKNFQIVKKQPFYGWRP